jgi:hypothetical protein
MIRYELQDRNKQRSATDGERHSGTQVAACEVKSGQETRQREYL